MPDAVLLVVGSLVPLLAVGLAFAAERARPGEPLDGEPTPASLSRTAGAGTCPPAADPIEHVS
jgi:hypothetical protein